MTWSALSTPEASLRYSSYLSLCAASASEHPMSSAAIRNTLVDVFPASSRIARTFSDMKSTPRTRTVSHPASAIFTAASAITSESEMKTCGYEARAAVSTPCTSASM